MSVSRIQQASEPESDVPSPLPPLEAGNEDEDESEIGALSDFLEPFQEDGQEAEEETLDLDVGVRLQGEETEPEPDGEPLQIDLRQLVETEEAPDPAEPGDDFGPDGFDPAVALEPDPADFGAEESEITGFGNEAAFEARLPPLDADTDGDAEGAIGMPDFTAPEEGVLPPARKPWLELEPPFRLEAIGALAVSDGHVLAGSGDLLWIQAGSDSPLRVAAEDSRLSSVCLMGTARDSAVCATTTGRLLRRPRLGAAIVLSQFREAAGLAARDHASLELCQLGVERSASVLLWLSTGKLLTSDDFGTTFRALDLPGRALAMSAAAAPAVALLQTRGGIDLWRRDGSEQGTTQRLPQSARTIAEGPRPMIAAWGELVVIADSERGATISNDGGLSFSDALGCVNATAIAAGMLRGRPSVWISVYRETEDIAELVQIDGTTLDLGIIARITGRQESEALDPSDTLDQARVLRLAWDAHSERLWAAGGFGLLRFGPPP